MRRKNEKELAYELRNHKHCVECGSYIPLLDYHNWAQNGEGLQLCNRCIYKAGRNYYNKKQHKEKK